MNIFKSRWSWLFVSLAVLGADQLSKYFARLDLSYLEPKVLTPFASFTLIYNQGAAFSFLDQAGSWPKYALGIFAVLVVVILLIYLHRLPKTQVLPSLASALVIGGAVSNLVDRIFFGYVTDFIDLHWGTWHWPAFNVADSAVCVGVILLLIKVKS